jgi:class 3 adenylate cyclase
MDPPPTGTVTFLFTDVAGSTRLAQQYPAGWPGAKARHHAILRDAIESHDGYVFQVIGDAFCAAFHTAPDAREAALDAQRALHAEPWGDVDVRVRMGVHTRAATLRAERDYEGYLALTRSQSDPDAFESASAEGRAMSLDEAIAYVLEVSRD